MTKSQRREQKYFENERKNVLRNPKGLKRINKIERIARKVSRHRDGAY